MYESLKTWCLVAALGLGACAGDEADEETLASSESELNQRKAWKLIGEGLPPPDPERSYYVSPVFDPLKPKHALVAGPDGALYTTTDSGTSWSLVKKVATEPPFKYVGQIAFDPNPDGPIYVNVVQMNWPIYQPTLLRKQRQQPGWTPTYTEVVRNVASIAIAPGDSNVIYLGLSGHETTGVVKSVNGGLTWDAPVVGAGVACCFELTALSPTHVYGKSSLSDEIVETTDGVNFQVITDYRGTPVVDLLHPGVLYALNANSFTPGFSKSVDGGHTWAPTSSPLSTQPVRALAVSRADSRLYLISGSSYQPPNALYTSTDGGETFTDISGALPSGIYDIVPHPTVAGLAIASTSGGLFRTTSAGAGNAP